MGGVSGSDYLQADVVELMQQIVYEREYHNSGFYYGMNEPRFLMLRGKSVDIFLDSYPGLRGVVAELYGLREQFLEVDSLKQVSLFKQVVVELLRYKQEKRIDRLVF